MKLLIQSLIFFFFAFSNFSQAYSQCSLLCNNQANLSILEPCNALVTAEMVLFNYNPACTYSITLQTQNGIPVGNPVSSSYIGQTLRVNVASGPNQCWGFIKIEDKKAPTIACNDLTVNCTDQAALAPPVVTDNCDNSPILTEISSIFTQAVCGSPFTGWRVQTYTATDRYGNIAQTCSRTIFYRKPNASQIVFPINRDDISSPSLSCGPNAIWDNFQVDGYPQPQESGVPTILGVPMYPNGQNCGLNVGFTDQRIDICGSSFKILRTWTVLDWCAPVSAANPVTRVQIIKIMDKIGPVFTCPSNFVIPTNTSDCSGAGLFPTLNVSDNCSSPVSVTISGAGKIINANGGFIQNIPSGIHSFTYTAKDACDNISTCVVDVTVGDTRPPVAICKTATTAAIGLDGIARLDALELNNGSYDDCMLDRFLVRRMANSCAQQSEFAQNIILSCCDVGTTVLVQFRAFDKAGNYNDCMVQVQVQDKLSPTIVCPPDITVNCDYILNINNLNLFGKVVTGTQNRDSIIIYQAGRAPRFVGIDGLAVDNCLVSVSNSFTDGRSNCGTGIVTRRFTATDGRNSNTECSQKISVVNQDRLIASDIQWPQDYSTTSCGAKLDTANIPNPYKKPIITRPNCSMAGIDFRDAIFEVDGGCRRIVRLWTVIDWCQKYPNGDYYSWSREQQIIVQSSTKPIIRGCRDTIVLSQLSNCGPVPVSIINTATDDCTTPDKMVWTYSIDLGSNGSFDINGSGNILNETLPYGTHKITWRVEDGCGNAETCMQNITIKDGKKPSPVCQELIAELMPTVCAIELWASDFIISNSTNDNCPGPYRYTFDAAGAQPNRIFTLADVGRVPVNIYMWDTAGNSDFCSTFAVIQNNTSCTNSNLTSSISGSITSINSKNKIGLPIYVLSNGTQIQSGETDSTGHYNLSLNWANMASAAKIQPIANHEFRNGLNINDVILMQNHILGVRPLDEYQKFAADINYNQTISVSDLIELKKAILFKIDSFANNSSWRFVKNPRTPDVSIYSDQAYSVQPMENIANANFTLLKIGDLDNSFNCLQNGLAETRSMNEVTIEIPSSMYSNGTIFTLPISLPTHFSGLQSTLFFDSKSVTFLGTEEIEEIQNLNISKANEGKIPFILDQTNKTLKLLFRSNQELTIDKEFTLAEDELASLAIHEDGEAFKPKIQGAKRSFSSNVNIFPNPVKDVVRINFETRTNESVSAILYSIDGKILNRKSWESEIGFNQVLMDIRGIDYYGMMVIEFKTKDQNRYFKLEKTIGK